MPTSVCQAFNDQTVLVTGFTGFLGKILTEKLLRSCPVRTVAVIVRNKKGMTAQQRVRDTCEKGLFDRIRNENPDFMDRIKVLDGCLEDPLLGLSSIDHDWIITNVNLIFHCAATVRFNETLEFATKTNIQGTNQLILLSTELKNLKGFVHVSTAYSHYPRNEIKEVYYPVPKIDYNDVNSLSGDNKSPAKILGAWPNTYTFTKAITENILMTNEHHLPISIFRPSIIASTHSEPQPGWVEGISGLTAIIHPLLLGLLRVTPISLNKKADIIPADYTVNALICVMWDTVNRSQKNTHRFLEAPKVFNYVSSVECPITWDGIVNEIMFNYYRAPPLTSMWYTFCTYTDDKWAINTLRIILHRIPAFLTDLYLMVTGEKPKMLKIYTKIEYMTDLLYKFTSKEWKFDNNNTRELWSSLSHDDRMTFWFSFEGFDWILFIKTYSSGVRKFILGEDQRNIEEALAKNRRLFWIHYSCVALITLFVLQVFWIFINYGK